jgi:hypothetical protein
MSSGLEPLNVKLDLDAGRSLRGFFCLRGGAPVPAAGSLGMKLIGMAFFLRDRRYEFTDCLASCV